MAFAAVQARYDLRYNHPRYNKYCDAPPHEENCCLCLKKQPCQDTGCFAKGGICVDLRGSSLGTDNTYPRNAVDLGSVIRGNHSLCRGTSSPGVAGEKCCQCYKRKSDDCLDKPAEIAFVVDHSGSMNSIWSDVKTWLEALIDAYKIDGITRKGGLVVWNSKVLEAETILFTDSRTSTQMKTAINALPSPSGGTNGALALQYTWENLFEVGSDPLVFREVIFIADGQGTPMTVPAGNFHNPPDLTPCIRITAVALGDFDHDQINDMLSPDCGDRFYTNEDSDELDSDEFLAELISCE